ncbi:MAG: HAD family hydrolase [Nocardioidaceae bacterium]
MSVQAVLFDADGVVQDNPAGWFDELHALVAPGRGREFVDDVFATEKPAMRGHREFASVLTEVRSRWGLSVRLEALLDHWRRIDVHAPVLEVVGELRASGVQCYLATNQHAHRAAHMRRTLGYDEVFDGQFYSCDLGFTKSSPAFFTRVLDELGLPGEEVLLVDDSEKYVETAREVGVLAEQWCLTDGVDELRALLGEHGLPV